MKHLKNDTKILIGLIVFLLVLISISGCAISKSPNVSVHNPSDYLWIGTETESVYSSHNKTIGPADLQLKQENGEIRHGSLDLFGFSVDEKGGVSIPDITIGR